MMVRVSGALIPLLLLATPAGAEDSMEIYQELTRTVQKRSDCLAAANPDEIVVCGRKQQNLRFRLPRAAQPAINARGALSVNGERFAYQQYRAEGGSGSCSTVGPNGLSGCTTHQLRELEEQNAGRGTGLIASVLTYLDPDE